MSNQYLEKVAANAYKRHLQANGLDTSGMSNASILAGLGQSKKTFSVPTGDKSPVFQRGLGGIGPKRQVGMAASGAMRSTGDVLAKGDLAKRLATYKTLKANAAKPVAATGVKALVGKAMGFAKKNPLLTAGAALAGGALAGSAMSRKSQPSYEQMQGY